MDAPCSVEDVLASCPVEDPQYATRIVAGVLEVARRVGASDVHFQPNADGLRLTWRIDGVLHPIGGVPKEVASNVVVRLKVLAKLLTYQTQMPQEGRIPQDDTGLEVRVSTFPTIFGEKVVARLLPTGGETLARVGDLGLPPDVAESVGGALRGTSGALLVVGPAGSGKTTTAYACLREIVAQSEGQRAIATIEDPVEVVVRGVAQSEVAEAAGFNLAAGLRSLVRQDPDVILVGEIRDPETAALAFQAALTGQLLITTFHAPDAAAAVSRLVDMGVPRYVLRSALNRVVGQQLLRRLCRCAVAASGEEGDALGVPEWRSPVGCDACRGTGYLGRTVVAEVFDLGNLAVASAVRAGADAGTLRVAAREQGMKSLYDQALGLVARGETSPAEVLRVFGINTREALPPPTAQD